MPPKYFSFENYLLELNDIDNYNFTKTYKTNNKHLKKTKDKHFFKFSATNS